MAISREFHDFPSSVFRPGTIAVPVVARPRLLSRITGPDARRVTMVAAPPGYGKTVLLTQAYEALTQQGRRCLWLSITGAVEDKSLSQLLWAALDRAGIPRGPSSAITVSGLLNRFESCAEPITIIMDGLDRHTLRSADAILATLIHGTPAGTCFLVATETAPPLPLLLLEAAGLLRRIGALDLALDDADIDALGRVTTLPVWISTVNGRVEGWPSIVQLALCRFRDEPEPAAPRLNGCHYEIAAFLERDVLRNLQSEELERLLDAAVVDQICGSLLDALSGSNDGTAILGKLVARGVPMRESRDREWFRLHPLLRDYLYDRFRRQDADRLALLHQRAANWLLSSGDGRAALRHATASGNIDFLRTIHQCLTVSQTLSPLHDLEQITDDTPVDVSSNMTSEPKWRLVFDLIQSGQLDQARKSIAEIRQRAPLVIGADLPDIRPVEWELIYSDLLMRLFDDRLPRPDQLEVLRDRLMRTPGVPPSISAAVSEMIIVSRFRGGDLSDAAMADQNLWHTSALAPTQSKIYLLMELGIAALEMGDLDLAGRHLRNAKALALKAFGPGASHGHAASVLLAEVAFERGDRAASAQMLEQSFAQLRHEELWFNLAASAFTTGSAEAAHRSWNDALQALELPEPLATHIGLWRLPPLLIAQRLRLAAIWSEDLEAARMDRAALSRLGLLDLGELDSAGFGWRVSVPAQLAVIRFDLADRKAEAALARSVALRPILEARRHVRRLIELNLLQGRAHIEMGNHIAGYTLIRAALKLSVETCMIQSFLDEVRFLDAAVMGQLLADDLSPDERVFLNRLMVKLARPSVRATRYVANGRTFDLSGREAQLLRALVAGKTFKEISFALNISINTTKMHRTRLYRKLGCNSRSHAIAVAQQIITG